MMATNVLIILSNSLLTLLWVALVFGYPGYQMMLYSWGFSRFDTDAARNDAFDLALSLGAALGIPQVTLVDHFNIAFASLFPLAWVTHWPRLQALIGGSALICSMYMFCFVAVFAPSKQWDEVPPPLIISLLMALSGLSRKLLLPLAYTSVLNALAKLVGCIALLAIFVSMRRVDKLQATFRLRSECVGVAGAYDEPWPSGFDFEPNGSGWPTEPTWPEGTGCTPEWNLVDASRHELNSISYLPLWAVLANLFFVVGGFVVSVALLKDDSEVVKEKMT